MKKLKIAVAGGTGLVGQQAVDLLRDSGHHVVSLSRAEGVDLVTGAGLGTALEGVDVVVDTSNIQTLSGSKSMDFFTAAANNLIRAARAVSARRYIVLSIVGVDRIPFGYYEAKFAQENVVRSSGLPVTVLRATQFHEFADQNLRRLRGPIAVIPKMLMRSVASSEVASEVVRLATTESTAPELIELAGPEDHQLVELARQIVDARNLRRVVIPVTLPGKAGRLMAQGALLPRSESVLTGSVTFEAWLKANH